VQRQTTVLGGLRAAADQEAQHGVVVVGSTEQVRATGLLRAGAAVAQFLAIQPAAGNIFRFQDNGGIKEFLQNIARGGIDLPLDSLFGL